MAAIPITDQIAEVERELRDRERRYPDLVARGRFKLETAERKLAQLSAAATTLRWLADNRTWIEAAHAAIREGEHSAQHRISHAALDAELADIDRMSKHPSVAGVIAAFPEATVVAVHTISRDQTS